jgi:hypothetical protein
MMNPTDSELVAQLLGHISELAALEADALQASGGNAHVTVVASWLTDAATGLGQAAAAKYLLDDVHLTDEYRRRIQLALETVS